MRAFLSALKGIMAFALCFALAAQPAAFAEGGEDASLSGIVDGDALEAMLEEYIQENNIDPQKISVGYCYTATGDTWYYNENQWYYSASMYKVPLMMILAEREHNGELTQDSDINGLTLSKAEDSILVHSNNDFAHLVMHYIGTDRECRELYQQYSDLPVEEYDPDFYDYSYFSARFMTDVVKTLYFEQERFPHIIDCLKLAQPDGYFHKRLGDEYEIAQKYGSYKQFNSTAGIIYTPNPFILTVMTEDMTIGGGENVIADLAVKFRDYTLTLDERLSQYQLEQEQAERQAQEEEQERLRLQQQEQARQDEQPEAPAPSPEVQPEKAAPAGRGAIIAVAAAIAALAVIAAIIKSLRKKPVAAGRSRAGRSGYTPKH